MAAARLLLGEPVEAITSARLAVEEMPTLVRGLSEQQGAASRQARAGPFDIGARAAIEIGNADALAYFLESGRAGALLESLGGRETLRSVVLPEPLLAAEHVARCAESRALAAYRIALDAGALSEIRAKRSQYLAARDAVRQAIERIQREAKAAADLVYPTAAPLAQIQGGLEDAEALVLFGFPGERGVALVVTAEEARSVRLPRAEVIDALAQALGADSPGDDTTEATRRLEGTVVSPLALPATARRVFVSPDGPLSLVPFSLLLPGREVVYIPSATTRRLLLTERERTGEGILALGDPDYETDGAGANRLARTAAGIGFPPLPGTREEAIEVGDVVLLGAEASEAGLRFALSRRPRWRAVHLACHGVVDPRHPLLSALALTPVGGDDGFLTALEVFGLRVPSDLTVLSACRTGKGKQFRAEGLVGFVRAFLYAGTPRVIVSLWNGDDRSSHALMTEFHRLWKGGLSTAGALRVAQEKVRAVPEWSHPYYWAGWSLWGLGD
jgi:CHAT domain-containing protein